MFCTLVIDRTDAHGGLFYWNEQLNSWVKKEIKVNLDNAVYNVKVSSIQTITVTPANEMVISVDGVVTNFEFHRLLKIPVTGVIGETIWEQDKWYDSSDQPFGLLFENIFYSSGGSAFACRLTGLSQGIYAKMRYAPKWFLCNEGLLPVSLVKSYFFEKDGIVYVTSDFTNKIYKTAEALPGKKYAEINVQPLQPMKLYGYQTINATSASGPVQFKSMDNLSAIEGNQLRATGTGKAIIKAFTDGNDSMYYSETTINVDIAKAENKITIETAAEYTEGDTIYIPVRASSGENVELKVIRGNATFNKNKLEYEAPGKVLFIATEPGNNSYEQADTVKTEVCINPKKPVIIPDTVAGRISLRSSVSGGNKWFFNHTFTSSEKTIFPVEQGLYTLQIVADGCSSTFFDPYNYIISEVPDIHYNAFDVFPNPVHDNATIRNSLRTPVQFTLTNMSGHVVFTGFSQDEDFNLNLAGFSPGIYILRIVGSQFTLYYKVLKQ
jgi:hypothetical protein